MFASWRGGSDATIEESPRVADKDWLDEVEVRVL